MGVVFHRPMNRIAGQSVLAGQRHNMAVLQSAESAVGGGPERAVLIESQLVDTPPAKPVGGCIRCADLVVGEVGDAAEMKSNPQPALRRVGDQSTGMVFMSQRGPRDALNLTLAG